MPARPVPGCWRTPCMGRTRGCGRMLETREQPYGLAVRSNHCLRVWTEEGLEETHPAAMADALARDAWATHAAGEGAKGLRLYEWARIALSATAAPGFEHWLLIRRSRREPDKRASYFACAPVGVSLGELAGAAGLRWTIEECFERAKDDLGLDHCEARSWHGWHRHMSLCMAARPSWPGWPPTCVGRPGAKRTKGVRGFQQPPAEPDRAPAARAREPHPSGPSPAQASDQTPLHHGLVALATTAPSQGRRRSLPPSS